MLDKLINRLERVAKINHDKFEYSISIIPNHEKFLYYFNVKETVDKHTFLISAGATIEEAILEAWSYIPTACEEWEYRDVA
jgi:hypothetical protein